MKSYLSLFFSISLLHLFLIGCGESDVNTHRGSTAVPARVQLDSVKNLPGKSVIYFTQPADKAFLYLKAVYQTDQGERSTSASYFTDSVTVEGFHQAGEYTVDLYSVSPGETHSSPLRVTINPKTPPYVTAYENMKVIPDFAGIRIITENEMQEPLTFYVYKKNEKGEWLEAGALYTRMAEIKEPIRGIEAVNTDFGIQVKDRWGHLSEMKEVNLTPYYEEMVDKSKINYLAIGEYKGYLAPNAGTPRNLYDGIVGGNNAFMPRSSEGYDFSKPASVTLDFSKRYKLSRFIVQGRRSGTNYKEIFANLFPREIEIWGRNDNNVTKFDPENDPGWTRLFHGILTRADGSTVPSNVMALTEADIQLAEVGNEFELPIDVDTYRYITFVSVKNYGQGSSRINVAELTFFGTPEDKITTE